MTRLTNRLASQLSSLARSRVAVVASVVAMLAVGAGCTNEVQFISSDGGAGGAGGAGGDGGSGGVTGEGGSVSITSEAIAYFQDDEPAGTTTTTGPGTTVSSGSSGPPDYQPLIVQFGSDQQVCIDPSAPLACGNEWRARFALYENMPTPGVFQLFNLNGFFEVTGDDDGGDECAAGGGTLDGLVEILSFDDAGVSFVVSGASAFEFDINGEYYAPRCAD